jgi:hypothetical protein
MSDTEFALRHLAEDIRNALDNACQVPPDFEVTFELERRLREYRDTLLACEAPPVPMILTCPACGARHIDEGDFATKRHHTHACQSCGMVWRPAVAATVGVRFLPGFKNAMPPEGDE